MTGKSQRLAYIDWMRGFACIAMFQTHCFDSWLGGRARDGLFFRYSQFAGSLPAPLFLFLAGISSAFVAERLRQKGVTSRQIARTTMLRGAQIFGLGMLFRLQEFLLGLPKAPWTDLLRVDVLNIIGLSLILIGALLGLAGLRAQALPADAAARDSFAASLRQRTGALAVAVATIIVLATPALWTTYRPRWLPWYLETYINGVHTFDRPQFWLFPVFPWAAYACVGLAAGFVLASPWARRNELCAMIYAAAAGALWFGVSRLIMVLPVHFYAVYDFWHTSPSFFLARVAVLLLLLPLSYAWCRWGAVHSSFKPLIELGQASLLVYWVHMQLVYGRLSILAKGAQGIPAATAGLVIVSAAMVALAAFRNRTKGRGLGALLFWRTTSDATVLTARQSAAD
jgi:uncharacterized membrane protein